MQVSQIKRAVKNEQWKQRIAECRSSGIPVKQWCKQEGIAVSTYYRYEQELLYGVQEVNNKLALEDKPQTLPVSFVEVPRECQAKLNNGIADNITISVTAPEFMLKITGETAAKALKEIKKVLYDA